MIRLIVCDDPGMVCTGLILLLEMNPLFQVVGQASHGEQLLGMMARPGGAEFDVLLLDLHLGGASTSDGVDLVVQLLKHQPKTRIIVVSMHIEPDTVNTVLQCGALGYVSKASSIEVLQEAITHAHQGRRFLDPNLVEAIVVKRKQPAESAWDVDLTKREREVMAGLCSGQRVSDIAVSLCRSVKTVSSHKIRLMEKLGIHSNADLIRLGLSHNLLKPSIG